MKKLQLKHWQLIQWLASNYMKTLAGSKKVEAIELCKELIIISVENQAAIESGVATPGETQTQAITSREMCTKLNRQLKSDMAGFSAEVLVQYGLLSGKWVVANKEHSCSYCKKRISIGAVTITGSGRVGQPRTHGCVSCSKAVFKQLGILQDIVDDRDAYYSSGEGEF